MPVPPVSPISFVIEALFFAVAGVLFFPIAVLFVECVAALLPARAKPSKQRPTVAVLVPAHNESVGIKPVLESLLSELGTLDRLIVIADNCSDDTAAIARAAGATVVERQDPVRRGKGFALDFGLRFLAANPPEVVVVVDADCLMDPGTLAQVAGTAADTLRPVQATYLMEAPPRPGPKDAVSALAFLVKNWVRPQGLYRLGFPGTLTGTGMAFPWSVISQVSLASGNIVEDMQLSMDLAILGHPTLFCPGTKVLSLLPQQAAAAKTQRTRWEHGHLRTMRTQIPRLLGQALRQRRLDLLAIAFDLSVPPLSLLVMAWLAATLGSVALGLFTGLWRPAAVLGIEGAMVGVAILGAWLKFGRGQLPARTLLMVPLYVLWKIPLYVSYIIRPQTKWVRTERDDTQGPPLSKTSGNSELQK